MKKYGLLGKKLGHSLSPFIHNILFEINGIKAEYKLYETDNVSDFVKNNVLDGFNVTIPYKKDIIDLCNNLHSSAAISGAVNCVDKYLNGYNTDVYGYRKSVAELQSSFDGKVLLLGCGGVGSMIAKQYNNNNLYIAIRNATKDRIESLKKQFEGATIVDIENIPCENFDLICNSTPVGMFPNIDNSPIDKTIVSGAKAVYDTIYNPYTTKLLSIAQDCGVKYKNGLDMLVYQAAKSHEYWYGGTFCDSDLHKIISLTKKELDKKW